MRLLCNSLTDQLGQCKDTLMLPMHSVRPHLTGLDVFWKPMCADDHDVGLPLLQDNTIVRTHKILEIFRQQQRHMTPAQRNSGEA